MSDGGSRSAKPAQLMTAKNLGFLANFLYQNGLTKEVVPTPRLDRHRPVQQLRQRFRPRGMDRQSEEDALIAANPSFYGESG